MFVQSNLQAKSRRNVQVGVGLGLYASLTYTVPTYLTPMPFYLKCGMR